MNNIWKPEHFSSPALLLIDLQNAFFENPALERQRATLLKHCQRLIDTANEYDLPVFNICTVHRRDKSTWTLSMLEDDQGFVFEGTTQAQNLAELDLRGSQQIIKHRDSAFFRTVLEQSLRTLGIHSLIIAGVSSQSCIAATAGDAFAANFRVAIAKQAVASEDPHFEKTTLQLLAEQHRQPAVDTESLINAISCPEQS